MSDKPILNALPSRNPESNWTMASATSAGLIEKVGKIPLAVDLRKRWWKIQNQGQTGACVGFSVAYGLLWYHNPLFKPSARFAWMGSKETDAYKVFPTSFCEMSGTYIDGALNFCRKYGSIPDRMLSMRAETTTTSEQVIYARAARNRIISYHRLDHDELKAWIATQGPIVCQLTPDHQFMSAKREVLTNYKVQPTGSGGHAIVLCGYGPDAFIVRNSWGRRWGHSGYAYVSAKYARYAFTECYGITV